MKFYLFLQLQPQDELTVVLEHEFEQESVLVLFSINITIKAVKSAKIVYTIAATISSAVPPKANATIK